MSEKQISLNIPLNKIFSNILPFLDNPSPFYQNQVSSQLFFQNAYQFEILVVGAGGLGCQIVKNLALSGIRNIHLIDMDTIDLTNLNRQFLFRQKDIGRYKAQVIAQFVMKRVPGVKIIPHTKKLQQFQFSFFQSFNIIIGGLDNVQARKYLNNIVHSLNIDNEQQQTKCFYIDGATEGFQGQVLFVQPFKTSCYQCSIFEGLNDKVKNNYCTIANTPRTPQHCIQYVLQILWEQQYGNLKRDNDNLNHMKWIYQKSLERAKQYNIQGVTQMLTMGVAKNIIPAIASTNALIASVITQQAFKLLTGCGPTLKNYFFYRGGVSIGSDTYENQKKQTCQACKMRQNKLQTLSFKLSSDQTLKDLLEQIKKTHKQLEFSIINHKNKILLNSLDRQRYQQRLNTKFQIFINQGRLNSQNLTEILYITDNSLKSQLKIQLIIQNK